LQYKHSPRNPYQSAAGATTFVLRYSANSINSTRKIELDGMNQGSHSPRL